VSTMAVKMVVIFEKQGSRKRKIDGNAGEINRKKAKVESTVITFERMYESTGKLAGIFQQHVNGKMFLVNEKMGYYYCKEKALWYGADFNNLVSFVLRFFKEYFGGLLEQLRSGQLQKTFNYGGDVGQLEKVLKDGQCAVNKSTAEDILFFCLSDLMNPDILSSLDNYPSAMPIGNKKMVDLKTLTVRERELDDYFTTSCGVNFLGNNGNFLLDFSKLIFGMFENRQQSLYVRKLLGYLITGESSERVVFIFCGDQAHFIIEIIKRILGKLHSTQCGVLFSREVNSLNGHELKTLSSARCIFFSDTDCDAIQNTDELIKNATEEDPVVQLGNDKVPISGKLVFATNSQLNIQDSSLCEKVVVIPFNSSTQENKNLIFKNSQDPSASFDDQVFDFVSRGAKSWYESSLGENPFINAGSSYESLPPRRQTSAVHQKKTSKKTIEERSRDQISQDIKLFASEICELVLDNNQQITKDIWVVATDLYVSYENWCKQKKVTPVSSKMFSSEIQKTLATKSEKKNGQRRYSGLKLK